MRFWRAEDGVLVIFGLFVLLVMMMAAGLAVDTIRHERERARQQATLDRAVLAAADLQQKLTPQQVVADHFAKAGLSDALDEDAIVVEQRRNYRSVSASAARDVPTMLLHMVGVDTLAVATTATAEEGADVEVSLVLDISRSMKDHGRLDNMKTAAIQFVNTLMPQAVVPGSGVTTISLVPYSQSVDVGAELMKLYGVPATARAHDFSNCTLFEDEEFASTALPPSRARRQYPHFRPREGYYRWWLTPRDIEEPLCQRTAADGTSVGRLVPLATDPEALRRAIRDLSPVGGTGIDIGMRWGVALLDPSARPVMDTLRGRGRIEAAAAGRPLDHGARGLIKVVVLMTDGDPDGQRDLHPAVRSVPSNVWYDRSTDAYSLLLQGSHVERYPYGTTGPVNFAALGPPDGIRRVAASGADDRVAPRWFWLDGGGRRLSDARQNHPYSRHRDTADRNNWPLLNADLRRLTWPEVFDRFNGADFVQELFAHPRAMGWLPQAEWLVLEGHQQDTNTVTQAVARLERLCDAAKEQGIVIYTVGFELENLSTQEKRDVARDLMQDCATSVEQHHFDVRDVEISEAFATIAGQIEQLRLTR